MERQLMILEVSQKQAYIFAPRELKQNLIRSAQIARVTSDAFFRETCPEHYLTERNLVYTGGGHAVLQFDTKADADCFAKAVSLQVLRDYPGMALLVRQMTYNPQKSPGENLNELSRQLEEKKARRESSFYLRALGVERPDPELGVKGAGPTVRIPAGWSLTDDVDEITGEDNFLAVIHIDGNAMGKRVQGIYRACGADWADCTQRLRTFSAGIDAHFAAAYDDMAQELAAALERKGWPSRKLPLRKLIGAGDDVCFITAGRLGLQAAASFLTHLQGKVNKADQQAYTACAGIVLIHRKFPFRRAYDLSEALCSNAKKFAREHGGQVSAMDYHIAYGQMKPTLSEIRRDYRTEDGGYLELRPLAVTGDVPPERRYDFLTALLGEMQKNASGLARSKIKALRTAFHQGELESQLAMRMTQTEDLLDRGLEKLDAGWLENTLAGRQRKRDAFFTDSQGKRRCLYFDAIELMDNTLLWREPGEEGHA